MCKQAHEANEKEKRRPTAEIDVDTRDNLIILHEGVFFFGNPFWGRPHSGWTGVKSQKSKVEKKWLLTELKNDQKWRSTFAHFFFLSKVSFFDFWLLTFYPRMGTTWETNLGENLWFLGVRRGFAEFFRDFSRGGEKKIVNKYSMTIKSDHLLVWFDYLLQQ